MESGAGRSSAAPEMALERRLCTAINLSVSGVPGRVSVVEVIAPLGDCYRKRQRHAGGVGPQSSPMVPSQGMPLCLATTGNGACARRGCACHWLAAFAGTAVSRGIPQRICVKSHTLGSMVAIICRGPSEWTQEELRWRLWKRWFLGPPVTLGSWIASLCTRGLGLRVLQNH